MPYIKKEYRKTVDVFIESLSQAIAKHDTYRVDGVMNYTISKLMLKVYDNHGYDYFAFNRMMGVLSCVKDELYRRVVAKYEDKKIVENGDIL